MTATESENVRYRVLIIEDEAPVRDVLSRIVSAQGFDITLSNDAESGLQAMAENYPHLLILDWMLPGMDSLELCQKLRAGEQGRYLTILMVSGKSEPEDVAAVISAGANFFMAKPIERKVLETWLSVARTNIRESLKRQADAKALANYQQELESYNEQLEEAVSRANEMAMEAEQAFIEINQIFKTVAGGILLVDKKCNLLRCNDSFLDMAGITRDEQLSGSKCYEIFHSCLCNTDDCPLHRIKKGKRRIESEIEKEGMDGSIAHYHIISTPFTGPGGDLIGVVEHITDITARVKAEKALKESELRYKELSIIDELTQLYNKRYFNKYLLLEVERARRHGYPLSLLLMDIDDFKIHNDTYGHADGDKVLARLGKIIAGAVRKNDIPCRYGGEEFTIILPDTPGEASQVVAERIRERFSNEVFYPTPSVQVQKTVSIGITQYRQEETEESLLERADHNMYEAKQTGKNRCVLK